MASQNPEMIRASIEETRRELAFSVNDLRSKMAELTDWRRQLAENRRSGSYGEPQVTASDLPADLLHRLLWWAAAALPAA